MKKLAFLVVVFLLALPLALAEFEVSVMFSPTKWVYNTTRKVGVVVVNKEASKEDLVRLELSAPLEDETPLYLIEDDFTLPPGWSYSLSYKKGMVYRVNFVYPKGLKPGEDVVLLMNSVKSPPEPDKSYEWEAKLISDKNTTITEKILTYTTFGKLKRFEIKNVPEEIRVGKSFEVTIIAYDEFGNVKEDYEGEISITSTDPKAVFPSTYEFKVEDEGKVKINFTYKTKDEQYFSISDEKENVSATSPKTIVLPAIPLRLSIKINEDLPFTTSKNVNLTLHAENAEECRYSNDGIVWTPYEAYTQFKSWELIPGEGTRVVYYQCRNEEGESEVVYDAIELEAPLVPFLPFPERIYIYLALGISVIALLSSLRKRRTSRKEE